jgi:hypothetical protein
MTKHNESHESPYIRNTGANLQDKTCWSLLNLTYNIKFAFNSLDVIKALELTSAALRKIQIKCLTSGIKVRIKKYKKIRYGTEPGVQSFNLILKKD